MAAMPILHDLTIEADAQSQTIRIEITWDDGRRHVVSSEPAEGVWSIEGDIYLQDHRYQTFGEAVERAIFTTTCQVRDRLRMEVGVPRSAY